MNEKQINEYLDKAELEARKSTCLRANYGVIIVKDDEIISSGYNEVPNGRKTCKELGYCIKNELEIPHGEGYSKCRAICGEQNAIIKADPENLVDSTLFLVGIDPRTDKYIEDPNPCRVCERFIINTGIKKIYVRLSKDKYKIIDANTYIENDTSF